ncbi:MAG TPA: Sec-independent protein translocase protein TatB [Rhodocyclaceae bacterium]
MFSSGELILIGLVALVVIGPERLPKVARAAGILLGRLQRYVSDVKADINREIQLDELKKMQANVAAQVRDMEQSVNAQLGTVEKELNESIAAGIEKKAEDPAHAGATANAGATAATAPVAVPEAAIALPAADAASAIPPAAPSIPAVAPAASPDKPPA